MSRPDYNDSDNEFYDACETMEHKLAGLSLTDENKNIVGKPGPVESSKLESYNSDDDFDPTNDEFMTMKTDFKDFESKEFLSRHENLTKENLTKEASGEEGGNKFVPLDEKLNNEMKTKQENTVESDDETKDEETDPFYVDEEVLEKEFSLLNEEELEVKFKQAQDFKAAGNVLFKEDKFMEALEEYTKALRSCPLINDKERSIFYSNRSICYLKLKDDLKCISDCSKSIEFNPKFVKPLLRRAECNQTLDKLDEALNDYKQLCELEPSNMTYKRKCFELEESIKARNEKLKEEMMGKLKELGNMCLKPFGLSTENFQFVQDPSTGSYSVNFNQGKK